tara:strand:- start:3661 stop:5154 length:1494 start_codon:yes stop_codon:yes gene_type:complete
MKKLLLILFALPITVLSQNTALLDSMLRFNNYQNNTVQELQSKSKFEYNSDNLITKKEELTYIFNTTSGTRTMYTYDSNNNIDVQTISNLDSNSWVNYMKQDDDYDISGNMTNSVILYWDHSLSTYINSSKTESNYNINNELYEEIFYFWDTISTTWIYSWKKEYSYASNGLIIMLSQYTWTNNSWEGHWKNEYEYDLNNNITKDSWYWWGWDGITYTWTPNSRYEYLYGINNNLLSKTSFTATNPSSLGINFQLFQKDNYSYNSNNEQIEHINLTFDLTTQSWLNSFKTESEYINSSIHERINYSWDATSSIWETINKTDYLYNINGISVTSISSFWSPTVSSWVYGYKTEEINDVNGNSLINTSYQWVATNNMWIAEFEVTGAYDNNYLCEETYVVGQMSLCDYAIQSCGILSNFNNNPLSNIFYDYSSNNSDSTIFFYSYSSTSIDEIVKDDLISERNLISISDMIGRESKKTNNELLFYIYDDGTVEKQITIE